MWISVQTSSVKVFGYQDQEREYLGLSGVLESRSTAVVSWLVPGRRPAGIAKPKTGLELL